MEEIDLIQRLATAERHLRQCLKDMETVGREAIRTDREYRRAKQKLTVALYEGRRPATLIQTMVLGDTRVSQLKEDRDLAQLRLDVVREDINATKKCMGIWNDMANREYYAG